MRHFVKLCLLFLVFSAFTTTLIIYQYYKSIYLLLVRYKQDHSELSPQNGDESFTSSFNGSDLDVTIVGQGRSGTTFIGELFNNHPEVFYVFEPLIFTAERLNLNIFYENETLEYKSKISSTMVSFLTCNFTSNEDTIRRLINSPFRYQSNALKKFAFDKNANKKSAFELSINLSRVCKSYRHRVVKILSGRLSNVSIETLRDVVKESSSRQRQVKIIHLVRDPRAVAQSWIRNFWIKDSNDSQFIRNIKRMCEPIAKNLRLGDDLPNWLINRYKLIRYEKMVANPMETAKEIFKFVGIKMASEVKLWIDSRKRTPTKEELNDIHSTVRMVNSTINKWKVELSNYTRMVIEKACSNVLKRLHLS